jgi:hypothetical protein
MVTNLGRKIEFKMHVRHPSRDVKKAVSFANQEFRGRVSDGKIYLNGTSVSIEKLVNNSVLHISKLLRSTFQIFLPQKMISS